MSSAKCNTLIAESLFSIKKLPNFRLFFVPLIFNFISLDALAGGSTVCSESQILKAQEVLGVHPTPLSDFNILIEHNDCLSYPKIEAGDGFLNYTDPAKFNLKFSVIREDNESSIFQFEKTLPIFVIMYNTAWNVIVHLTQVIRRIDEIKVNGLDGKCLFSILPPEFSAKIDITTC